MLVPTLQGEHLQAFLSQLGDERLGLRQGNRQLRREGKHPRQFLALLSGQLLWLGEGQPDDAAHRKRFPWSRLLGRGEG